MSHAATIQKLIDAFNNHDAGAFASFYAENAVVYDPQYPEPLRGKAAIEKDVADFFRAFPDIKSEARTSLANDRVAATEFKMSGTNKGALAGPDGDIPATGKKMTLVIAVFSHFNNEGKIVEEHRHYNVADLMEQLGLTEPQTS